MEGVRMRKRIATLAVAAAALVSVLGISGHADAQSACVTVSLEAGPAPVALPVAVPVGVPEGVEQTVCVPPSGGVPGLPAAPGLPSVPSLPV
jgi:hypothetical protein